MTIADQTPYPLGRPLPVEVVAGKGQWLGYRRYPVFSARWLLGRTLVFGACIGAFSTLIGISMVLTTSPRIGVLSALHFFAGIFMMACFGPLLATLVRHRGWPLRRERIGVVVAVLLGIVVSYFADSWASEYLKSAAVEMKQVDATVKPPPLSAAGKAAITTLNIALAIAIYAALGGGFALRAYFRELGRWREARHADEMAALQDEKQRADLQLGVLQAQVEPHFLFNTLASVRALVRQDAGRAEETLDALVDYLRATIPKMRDGECALHSTLGQQLDICAHYLELMRLRTAGRLQYAIDADADARALEFPPLLLINLVENAIKHGIEPKPGPGRVTVTAIRERDALTVRVEDDGMGLQPGIGGGLGLANVRARLDALYRGRAAFELRGAQAGGARAELRIPLTEDAAWQS